MRGMPAAARSLWSTTVDLLVLDREQRPPSRLAPHPAAQLAGGAPPQRQDGGPAVLRAGAAQGDRERVGVEVERLGGESPQLVAAQAGADRQAEREVPVLRAHPPAAD